MSAPGPTGLTLAISLLARGRTVTILDKKREGDNTSRAAVVYQGLSNCSIHMASPKDWLQEESARRNSRFGIATEILMPVPFEKLPTSFPYALLTPQDVTEKELGSRLRELGERVLRPCEVTEVTQDDSGVAVGVAGGEQMRARFLVGADGAHSAVREKLGIAFEGDAAGESYSLADVRLNGGVPDNELVVYFSPAGHLVVLPLPGGVHRVVAHVSEAPEQPDSAFIQNLLDTRGPKSSKTEVREVTWFLTRHAIARRYRLGRVVLAGDAAHEHSPLGGQGMNLGIHDAIVLARTLSMILEGEPLDLLDRYDAAQRPVAEEVISITNALTKIATVHEHLREARNLAVSFLDPVIRGRLAWRLSLLGYNETRESIRAA